MKKDIPEIFESEYRFMEILWDLEPVASGRLVEVCNERFEWKKSTTYTVIRRLTDRGIITSKKAIVTSLVSREDVQIKMSHDVVERSFAGSLPGFIAAFAKGRKLSAEEISEIRNMIDEYERS